jgi:predicted ATPase/DNA-binding XRE family transcriptional regulator
LDEVTFGEWLKRRRKTQGLTQAELALQINCSTSLIKKVEAEERFPSRQIVKQLADVFSILPDERESFQKFARGDWMAAPTDTGDAPWRISHPQHNLPIQLTSFIGREEEIADAIRLLESAHLLTLIGPGGTGKTRLSIQVANEVLKQYPDGVWLVELAPILDPLLVPRTTAIAIGLRDEPHRPVIDMLCDYLLKKKMLIILDNCEHLVDACAQMTERILQTVSNVKVLASSREALGIEGEVTYSVPPLKMPDLTNLPLLDSLSQYEAVKLFIDRAASAVPNFKVTNENAPTLVQICHRLDGVPLAIELAAAKIRVLGVEQIARRLDNRFKLLTGGNRTALKRHQTLGGVVDWSYNLLLPKEQVLFRRLSVFVGGWSLKAAESVCGDAAEQGTVRSDDVLDLLEQLINKSLVITEDEHGTSRFRMLETIRQYAKEKLVESGESDVLHDKHLEFFLNLAESAEPHLRKTEQVEWLQQLDAEIENLRAALGWAMKSSSAEIPLRLTGALGTFWELRDYWLENAKWLDQALDREWDIASRTDKSARAKALYRRADVAIMLDDVDVFKKSAESALALYKELGDAWGIAYTRALNAFYLMLTGNMVVSQSLLEQSLTDFQNLRDVWGEYFVTRWLIPVLLNTGNPDKSMELKQRALVLARTSGDRHRITGALISSAYDLFLESQLEEAEALLDEAEQLSARIGSAHQKYMALEVHYQISLVRGDFEKAKEDCDLCIEHFHQVGEKNMESVFLIVRALISELEDDIQSAVKFGRKSLDVARGAESTVNITIIFIILGRLEYQLGNIRSAYQLVREGLEALKEVMEFRESVVSAFCHLGGFLVEQDAKSAVQILAKSESLVQALVFPRDPTVDLNHFDRFLATAREKLSEAEFTAAWEAGLKMSDEEAVELALKTVKEK